MGSLFESLGMLGSITAVTALLVVSACNEFDRNSTCPAACDNIMTCQKGGYDDGDLVGLTRESCLSSCRTNEDLDQGATDEKVGDVQAKWVCAAKRTSCASLDSELGCDIF